MILFSTLRTTLEEAALPLADPESVADTLVSTDLGTSSLSAQLFNLLPLSHITTILFYTSERNSPSWLSVCLGQINGCQRAGAHTPCLMVFTFETRADTLNTSHQTNKLVDFKERDCIP